MNDNSKQCKDKRDVSQLTFKRMYKQIQPYRILDVSLYGLELCAEDEIFVRITDCRDYWISNYGRGIKFDRGIYAFLQSDENDTFTVEKDICLQDQYCGVKEVSLNIANTVVQEFVVNPDCVNNTYIWHRKDNVKNNYYKDLYPMNEKQYAAMKEHYHVTGSDSEEEIIQIMNTQEYYPDGLEIKHFQPTVCGVGYWGCSKVQSTGRVYERWSNMLKRCYRAGEYKRYAAYEGCEVCPEWHSYSNFKKWFDEHYYKYGTSGTQIDKDILYKGNKIYSPATCCIVPKEVNDIIVSWKQENRTLPLGVSPDSGRYKATMKCDGKKKHLGLYDTPKEAFDVYKFNREKYIKEAANRYDRKIPSGAIASLMNWEIEITD